jgi:hypothetical protein
MTILSVISLHLKRTILESLYFSLWKLLFTQLNRRS